MRDRVRLHSPPGCSGRLEVAIGEHRGDKRWRTLQVVHFTPWQEIEVADGEGKLGVSFALNVRVSSAHPRDAFHGDSS